MCTREEVREEIKAEFNIRDKNRDKKLDEKLSNMEKKIYKHLDSIIKPIQNDCVFRKNEQDTLKIYLNEHTEQNRKDFDKLMQEVIKMNVTVDEKLLPAYEDAQKKEIAIEWMKGRAKSWQFWIKAIGSIFALGALIKWVINNPNDLPKL